MTDSFLDGSARLQSQSSYQHASMTRPEGAV